MIAKFICSIVGHKPQEGPLKRSPYTSYTHWRDVTCSRCGHDMGRNREWRDALTEPELFREPVN
ncbi:hypothetical protein CHY08_07115 [Rhizobium leguminosarum bv. viciae]|nr:hypothetical protein CHY08_07115 [Rhizobium leguminosarum bv. viciae]